MNIEDPIDDWNIHLEIGITDARTLHRIITFALENGYDKDDKGYLTEMQNQFYMDSNVHIPKNNESAIFSINTVVMNIFK